jgi:hypothetical protein
MKVMKLLEYEESELRDSLWHTLIEGLQRTVIEEQGIENTIGHIVTQSLERNS